MGEALSTQLSARMGGVIPTFAMNIHAQELPKVYEKCFKQSGLESAQDLDAVAVTNRPGLNGSLIIGTNFAKYICTKHKKRKKLNMVSLVCFLVHCSPLFSSNSYSPYGSACSNCKVGK